MYDISFTKADIEKLTEKLGVLAAGLSKSEWGLLLGIFAAAADDVEVDVDQGRGKFSGVNVGDEPPELDREGATPDQLRNQLRKAYIPGKSSGPITYRITPVQPGNGP